jgi:probable O-glycosylation ligase (exosortase A-associated)
MRGIIFILIMIGALPLILKQPYIGILMWSWLGYMNPHRLVWGLASRVPWSMIVAVGTLASVVFSRQPKRFPWTPVTIVHLLFVLWMCVTTFFAFAPDAAWEQWERMIKVQLMTMVTLMVMGGRERLHALIWVIVLSIGFWGIKGGLWAVLISGGQYMVWGPPHSFFAGNNGLALALIMTLPLMRYLQLQTVNAWGRRGFTLAMILMTVAILCSYSRGAFLGLAVMGLFLWFKSHQKGLIGLAILLLVPAMLLFMPAKWFERIESIRTYEQDGSAMARINAWWFLYYVAKDRPFLGGGFDVFANHARWYLYDVPDPDNPRDSHSIYFEVLGEHGFVGLGLFLSLGFLAWRTASWISRYAGALPDLAWAGDLAVMGQVSMVGYAVTGAFLGMAYFDLYYHLIAILVLTRQLVEEELSEYLGNVTARESDMAVA